VPRRKSSAGITIGFFGTAEMDTDQAQTLVEEHLSAHPDDPLHFVFVVTSDEYSETVGELVTMAVNSEIPYEVITWSDDKSRSSFRDAISAASKTHSVSNPVEFLKTLLVESPGGRLFILWDKEREDEMQEIATGFLSAGVSTYDLTDGLTEIGFPEGGESTEEEDVAEGEVIYSKSELQKLDRQQLWQIADSLGVKRSRSNPATIEDILEKQGEVEEAAEATVSPEEPPETQVAVAVVEEVAVVPEEIWERLDKSLDQFTTRLLGGLENLLAKATPVATEPEPEPEPQPTRRRLQRSRS